MIAQSHLDEDEIIFVLHDQINFTSLALKVFCDELQALCFKIVAGELFSIFALLVTRELGHWTKNSAGRQAERVCR